MAAILAGVWIASLGAAALGRFLAQALQVAWPQQVALIFIALAGIWFTFVMTLDGIGGTVRMTIGAYDYTPRRHKVKSFEWSWFWQALPRALFVTALIMVMGWLLGWLCSLIFTSDFSPTSWLLIVSAYALSGLICLPIQMMYFIGLLRLGAELKPGDTESSEQA